MHDFVPVDADLVLVEFVNDWEVVDAQNFAWMDNSLRQATTSSIGVCQYIFIAVCMEPLTALPTLDYACVVYWEWTCHDDHGSIWSNCLCRRGFERLIRKLLSMDSSPAVLLLHWWAPLHFKSSFWNVAEDELDTIGSYYDLQVTHSFPRPSLCMPAVPDSHHGVLLDQCPCSVVACTDGG